MGKTNMKKAERARHNAKIVKRMWMVFGAVAALLLLLFILIYNGIIGYMPEIDQLKNPTTGVLEVIQ